jgi:hypothetical protein
MTKAAEELQQDGNSINVGKLESYCDYNVEYYTAFAKNKCTTEKNIPLQYNEIFPQNLIEDSSAFV